MDERTHLTQRADFELGRLKVSPSACRVIGAQGEIRIQAQTMAALVILAQANGGTVSRDELVQSCWQGRVVSDDAVSRTIAKVRALAAATAPAFTLETLPKVGYRLLVDAVDDLAPPPATRKPHSWLSFALPVSATACILAAGFIYVRATASSATPAAPPPVAVAVPRFHSADVADAVLTLDEARLQLYLNAGWRPDWHLDSEGNAALHVLMEVCERNPTHDKAGVVRVAQRLVAAGANPALPNKWGDTPLVIARARRYCGPDHPVVAFLRNGA
ncbi:MAG TPA: winged helix-turn-helix domain-containing protein [Caulobacteraceae bacterium]|jgi:DNA-binding winged helix-turn-helix (wHTH) protein|nr:winged helix-turn-helix domain-containing protein [Caulobacteraceae bacterium]